MGRDPIERLHFLAPGSGAREGGEKTQPFNWIHSRLFTIVTGWEMIRLLIFLLAAGCTQPLQRFSSHLVTSTSSIRLHCILYYALRCVKHHASWIEVRSGHKKLHSIRLQSGDIILQHIFRCWLPKIQFQRAFVDATVDFSSQVAVFPLPFR